MNDQILYTLAQAAEKVGMSERTLRREFQQHNLAFKERGGKYYVLHGELVRWAESLDAPAPRAS